MSDAGTPGISDPGALLAAECAAAGVPLVPVPGACAAIAALSISGFAAAGFRFGGFLPRAGRGRREALAALVADERAAVLYESPHRVVATLRELADAAQLAMNTRPLEGGMTPFQHLQGTSRRVATVLNADMGQLCYRNVNTNLASSYEYQGEPIRFITEVQFHFRDFFPLGKLLHKTYEVCRAKTCHGERSRLQLLFQYGSTENDLLRI